MTGVERTGSPVTVCSLLDPPEFLQRDAQIKVEVRVARLSLDRAANVVNRPRVIARLAGGYAQQVKNLEILRVRPQNFLVQDLRSVQQTLLMIAQRSPQFRIHPRRPRSFDIL